MTFEEVDQHVNVCPNLVEPKTLEEVNAVQLCTYYATVKPVLTILVSLPFLPAKWKTTLTNFVAAMNLVCP